MPREFAESALALYPTSRGFGFVMFESNGAALDWGTREAKGEPRDRNAATLAAVEKLLDRYAPDCVVIEDFTEPRSRRSKRIHRLYRSIAHAVYTRGMDLHIVSKQKVREAFGCVGAATRHEIALAVSRSLPGLAHRLPPKRKAWESEKAIMGMFAAAALGAAFYGTNEESQLPLLNAV